MKTQLLILASMTIFLLGSCTKGEPLILSPQEKLQGEWMYTQAVFVENFGLRRTDVLRDYADWRVSFDGYEVQMEDLKTGQILHGSYELYQDDTGGYYDEAGNYVANIERFMSLIVFDSKTHKKYYYDWQVNYLTRNKLFFGEFYRDGNYSFKMIKLQ